MVGKSRGNAEMRYTQTIIVAVGGLGLSGVWLFNDKAVLAHHRAHGPTLVRAVIFLAIAGLRRDRRAYAKRRPNIRMNGQSTSTCTDGCSNTPYPTNQYISSSINFSQ